MVFGFLFVEIKAIILSVMLYLRIIYLHMGMISRILSQLHICLCLLLELMLDTSCVEAPRSYVLCICIQMQITYMHTCRGSASMFCHHACLYSDSLANPYIVIKHQKGGD